MTSIHRCLIPECDDRISLNFKQDWIEDVLPGTNSGNFIPQNCAGYNFTAIVNEPLPLKNNSCPAEWFDRSEEIRCNEWVFQDGERTIVNDVI